MEAYTLPSGFYSLLCEKYARAKENGEILFNGGSAVNELIYDSSSDKSEEGDKVPFELTLLKSLMHRPEKGSVDTDPFAQPEPELTVLDKFGVDDSLRIIFNRFPVVDRHFMVVTRAFVSQNSPLTPEELMATYSILKELKQKDTDNKWFSFYNCGPASGMLQPHKHIQFMTLPHEELFQPIPEIVLKHDEQAEQEPSSIAKHEPLQHPKLPFAHYIAKLPENVTHEDQMGALFVHLLTRTVTDLRDAESEGISYNFVMTTEYMMMVPRTKAKIEGLGLNSCGYMSLLLCKSDELVAMVKEKQPLALLAAAGLPNTHGIKRDDSHY